MELIAALAILAIVTVSLILPIYLFVSHRKLSNKVRALEARLGEGPAQTISEPVAEEPKRKAPWKPAESKPEPAAQPLQASPPKSFVLKADLLANVIAWLQKNWFFAVAALSLALAGVFLVQYGVENGLLSPARRVMAALAFGGILIVAGEYIRRKTAGDEDGHFALLPSVFAGAGLVSLFAGVLSARVLYELIGPGMAFFGLGLTGIIAIVLGWFYGPLLAIVGVSGALAAPFLVGGSSESSHFLQLYFAGIAAVGLTIDSVKRWAWLSSFGLIGAYIAAFLVFTGGENAEFFVLFALITAGLSVTIPVRNYIPSHQGSMVSQFVYRFKKSRRVPFAEFPTRVASGAYLTSVAIIVWVFMDANVNLWLSLAALTTMFLAAIFWFRKAPALSDMAFLPAIGALIVIAFEGIENGPVLQEWIEGVPRDVTEQTPTILAILLAGGLVGSLLFAWRSYRGGKLPLLDTIFAGAFAPFTAIVFQFFWSPEFVLGRAGWAIYLAVVAIVMTLLSERFARKDGDDRIRTALFALSAMSMISFMAFTLLGDFALTLAIGVQVLAAAWLARQFNLPLLDRYVQIGVLTVSWRLVLIPGLDWALEAPIWEVSVAFLGVIALLIGAYLVKRENVRVGVVVMLESSIWSIAGVFIATMVGRYFDYIDSSAIYLILSLIGTIWLISAANQLYRLRPGAGLRRTRIVLASIYSLLGGLLLLGALLSNPLNNSWGLGEVSGPIVFDSLAAAYGIPAMLFAFVAYRFTHLHMVIRKICVFLAAFLASVYIGLEIRRWWHGSDLDLNNGVLEGELYSYTIAMMLVAVALLVMAFLRQSALLRRFALIMIALTVAKVYLIDVTELNGLLRAVSVLVLGLVLVAMAWVNRILQNNEAVGADPEE